jgi:hypothetical protein
MAANWLSPPAVADPQSTAPPNRNLDFWNWESEGVDPPRWTPPGVARPPAGLSMKSCPPALPGKAPPPGLAKAPPRFPADVHIPVVAPLARESPSSSTRAFEEIVNATERRISDSINTKMSEMANLVKDLERQIVLLREDLAAKESTVTPGDRDASAWDDGWWQQDEGWWHPAPYSNNEDGWNWSYPVSWDDADWDAWTQPATAEFYRWDPAGHR